MLEQFPPCPKCESTYVYPDQQMLICPECGHEWEPKAESLSPEATEQEAIVVKDSNGNILQENDKVTLIKDLKVKGTSTTLKVGTKAVIKRLADGDHDLDCKVEGAGQMMLKSEFVKKAQDR